ncbi:MAG TPA: hypothetical protein VFS46_00715 [Nitrososphaera sp.]|nr:hypothetical protein [Nitrososphaera sp.]
MPDKWDHNDNEALLPWLLRGIYEMKGGVIGRTVLMTKVVEYIKMKNYWGNEKELGKYLRIDAGDSYRRNLYRITRWMVDRGLLRPHAGFNEVSITRQGISMIGRHFPELQ